MKKHCTNLWLERTHTHTYIYIWNSNEYKYKIKMSTRSCGNFTVKFQIIQHKIY